MLTSENPSTTRSGASPNTIICRLCESELRWHLKPFSSRHCLPHIWQYHRSFCSPFDLMRLPICLQSSLASSCCQPPHYCSNRQSCWQLRFRRMTYRLGTQEVILPHVDKLLRWPRSTAGVVLQPAANLEGVSRCKLARTARAAQVCNAKRRR